MSTLLNDIEQLSIAERIQLVEDLWDSVAARSQNFPITDAQKRELDRRLMQHQNKPTSGSSLHQIAHKLGVTI